MDSNKGRRGTPEPQRGLEMQGTIDSRYEGQLYAAARAVRKAMHICELHMWEGRLNDLSDLHMELHRLMEDSLNGRNRGLSSRAARREAESAELLRNQLSLQIDR